VKPLKRNRAATTQRIVEALEEVLKEEGLSGVHVNTIAEKAGVSKVLVYRYFGSLEGLLEYYIRQGHLIPHYTHTWLEQIQPAAPADLAPFWASQVLQLVRQFRASRTARELLKATVKPSNSLTDTISQTLDAEMTYLVHQISFIEGGDYQAISAVILGALSYLTLQAQYNLPVIGLDLRQEDEWRRIEEAVKLIYKGMAKSAFDSQTTQVVLKQTTVSVDSW
jgi:AcrR family transcriptional regulator